MKKREILTILILAIMVFSLASCRDTTPTGNTSLNDNNEAEKIERPAIFEEKTVADKDMTITLVEDGESLDIEGKYTGKVKSGKPEGYGEWIFKNDNGYMWKYKGEFSAGMFNGYGVSTITTTEDYTYKMEGNYTDGEYTPTAGQAFNYSDYNYYSIYYFDSVEVYDDDTFTVYAIPCFTSSFDNVGGGTTSVIVLLGCYME